MEKNQNAEKIQQNGSNGFLEKTLDGKKTHEIDPNNPVANKANQGSNQDEKEVPNVNHDKKETEVNEMKEEKSDVGTKNAKKENA